MAWGSFPGLDIIAQLLLVSSRNRRTRQPTSNENRKRDKLRDNLQECLGKDVWLQAVESGGFGIERNQEQIESSDGNEWQGGVASQHQISVSMPDRASASEEVDGVCSCNEEDDNNDNGTSFAKCEPKSDFGGVGCWSDIDIPNNEQDQTSDAYYVMGDESLLRGFVRHAFVAIFD